MQPVAEKTENKIPSLGQPEKNNASVKTSAEQEKKAEPKKQHSYYSGILDQFDKDTLLNKVLNFIGHPFVLLGALIATVFFLSRGKQDNVKAEPLPNAELLHEIKKLKKQNKKLRAKLELLSGTSENEGETKLPLRKIPLRVPPHDSKPQTFYLD